LESAGFCKNQFNRYRRIGKKNGKNRRKKSKQKSMMNNEKIILKIGKSAKLGSK